MSWLFVVLAIVGVMFSVSGYGAKTRKQRMSYWIIAGAIWITILILANTIL